MDVFALQASIGLDTSSFSKSIGSASKMFENLEESAEDARKPLSSYKGDVMKLAQAFRKEGMTMSDALKKAYQNIDKSLYGIGQSSDSAGKKAKNAGKNIKSSGNDAKSAGGKFESLRKSVSALDVAFGSLLASGIRRFASAIPDFAQSVVNAAAMVSAEVAQFEATFGDLGETAETVFSGMAADTGIVADRLKTLGTKAFAQFKGAGLEADQAIVEMDRHMRLAADAAAYYDISLEDADERLRSFERGNTEAGDAIGLFTSESQRNSYALERYGKKWIDLSEAQKQMLMLDVAEDIYNQSGAMGQAERESNNLANVLGNLSSVWQRDVLAVIGAPIESAFTPFAQELTEFLQNETVQEKLKEFGEILGGIAEMTFDGIMDFLNQLLASGSISEALQSLAENGSDAWSFLKDMWTLAEWLVNNQEALVAVAGTLSLLWTAMHPKSLIFIALSLIISNWETIEEWVTIAYNAIVDFFSITIPAAWNSFIQGIVDGWNSVVSWIQSAIDKVNEFLGIEAGAAGIGGGDAPWYVREHPERYSGYTPKATGLTRVPYDNFPALLHRDEAVLTRTQAADWRAGRSGNVDVSAIASAVYSAVVAGMSGVSVNMDSQRVGDMVTGRVSQNIAMAAWEGRYA